MGAARDVVDRYYMAMTKKDFASMHKLLQDDVTFRGPLGETNGADEYVKAMKGVLANMVEVNRKALFAEGDNVCHVYDLVLSDPAVTLSCAQWIQMRDDRIAAVRLFFDPRPLVQPAQA